jgi:hypothetical protein
MTKKKSIKIEEIQARRYRFLLYYIVALYYDVLAPARKDDDMAADNMARLEDVMTQLGVTMRELAAAHKETERVIAENDRKLAENRAELERKLAENRAELERKLAESLAENDRKRTETDRKLTESLAELDRKLTENINRVSESVDKWVGHFGTNIGTLVELTLIPGIKQKMKNLGHDFDSLAPRKQYYRKDGNMLAEVDLFLENGVEVMAVEVKTQFNASSVEYHVKRLQLLRKHDAERLKGKAILAAIAGLSIDRDAQELALGRGMYVIKMVEDDKNITVIEPAGGVGKW